MSTSEHHYLIEVELDKLRPTQMTAGFAEVAQKRAEWARLAKKARRNLLDSHWFPSVLGRRSRHHLIDHHRLGLALLQEGVERVRVMEPRSRSHPFDQADERRSFDVIPTRIPQLVDDPYRSLTGFLRAAGGYAKDTFPCAELLWAGYLRQHISTSMEIALREAPGLAKSPLARYLLGWSGVTPPAAVATTRWWPAPTKLTRARRFG
jgi:hypothetical protein